MAIDALAGLITWVPTGVQVGVNAVTVQVEDSLGASDTQSFTITVADVNEPPILEFIGNQTVDEGTELTFTATASDPDIS